MTSFQQLKKELDNGEKRPFYIFTGSEKEVIQKYIKRVDEKVKRVSSFDTLWKNLTSNSLFTSEQTFLLENDKDILQFDLEKLLNKLGKNKLILLYGNIDKRVKFFKQAKKYIVEFDKFNDSQLVGYIQSKIDVSPSLAQLIAKYSNNEVSRIDLEIHKLKQLREEVTFEMINELITPPADDRIFEMIDSVAKKDKKKAFSIYYDLLELKESPIKIVSLLYTKFKQIFLVQSYFELSNAELAGKTGLTFYQVNFARDLSGYFSNEQIVQILKTVQQTEVEMKTGRTDIELSMENLLIKIMQ